MTCSLQLSGIRCLRLATQTATPAHATASPRSPDQLRTHLHGVRAAADGVAGTQRPAAQRVAGQCRGNTFNACGLQSGACCSGRSYWCWSLVRRSRCEAVRCCCVGHLWPPQTPQARGRNGSRTPPPHRAHYCGPLAEIRLQRGLWRSVQVLLP